METHITKVVGDKTLAALTAQLRAAHQSGKPPAGAFSQRDYAEANGISYDKARRYIDRLIASGVIKHVATATSPHTTRFFQFTKKSKK